MQKHLSIVSTLLAIASLFSCKKPNSGTPVAPGAPIVTTTAATGINADVAIVGGNITSHGGSAIISSGVITDTSPSFYVPRAYDPDQGKDNFTVQMPGLYTATTYYYRAFAVNSTDSGYGAVQQFTTTYTPSQDTVSTFAGTGAHGIIINGPALQSTFSTLSGMAIDPSGNAWIAEYSSFSIGDIRKISGNGTVSTLVSLNTVPSDIVTDAAGNLYVAASSIYKILKITPSGVITTFAGSGNQASIDGTGTAASFYVPFALDIDTAGNLYVADSKSLRKITPAGVVTTLPSLSFLEYYAVAVDRVGNIYASDGGSIKKIDTLGKVTLVAGSLNIGMLDGLGNAAAFNSITGLRTDKAGNLYAADFNNNKVRMITPSGQVTTLAGTGKPGSKDNDAALATFYYPVSVHPDQAGNIYVLDLGNCKIRKISHK